MEAFIQIRRPWRKRLLWKPWRAWDEIPWPKEGQIAVALVDTMSGKLVSFTPPREETRG